MVAIALIVGVAFASTLLWLGTAYSYLAARFGAEGLVGLDSITLAVVVGVAFVPVLIVWLVAGLFGFVLSLRQQGQVIRQLLWQAKRSADHTDVTSRLLIEQRQQARGDAFFLTFRDARDDLNGALASLAVRGGMCSAEALPTLWVCYDCGDRSVFCQLLRNMAERDDDIFGTLSRMMADDARMRADAQFFLARYDRLIRLGNEWDEQRHVLDLVQEGDLGLVQKLLFKAVHTSPQASRAQPPPDAAPPRPARVWPKGFPPADALLGDVQADAALIEEALAEGDNAEEEGREEGGRAGPFSPLAPDFPKQIPSPAEPGETDGQHEQTPKQSQGETVRATE